MLTNNSLSKSSSKIQQQAINKITQFIYNLVYNQNSSQIKTTQKIQNLQIYKKMHQKHRQSKLALQQKQKLKLLKQNQQLKNFRVQNQKSIQINKRKKQKPIFERASDIMKQREKQLNNKRMINQTLIQKSKDQMQNVSMCNGSSFSQIKVKNQIGQKGNFKKFYQKIINWQKKKNNDINKKKAQIQNQIIEQIRQKPQLNNQTVDILKKSGLFQKSFIQRCYQYQKKKQDCQKQIIKQIQSRQTPFNPKIGRKSLIIASKSSKILQTPYVFDRISKSPSQNCIKKPKYMEQYKFVKSPSVKQTKRTNIQQQNTKLKIYDQDITFSTPRSQLKNGNLTKKAKQQKLSITPIKIQKSMIQLKKDFRFLQKVNQNLKNHSHQQEKGKNNMNNKKIYNQRRRVDQQLIKNKNLNSLLISNKQNIIQFVKQMILQQKND